LSIFAAAALILRGTAGAKNEHTSPDEKAAKERPAKK